MNFQFGPSMRVGLVAVLLLGVSVALFLGREVFVPFVLALLLAAMLWPAVGWLHGRMRLSWAFACLVTVTLFVAVMAVVGGVLAVSVGRFVVDLGAEAKQRHVYLQVRNTVEQVSPWPLDERQFPRNPDDSEVFHRIRSTFNPEREGFTNLVWSALGGGVAFLWEGILIAFILLFLLIEGRMLTRRLACVFGPTLDDRGRAAVAIDEIADQLRAYLGWRTLINLLSALLLGVVYALLGLSQPWTWAILAFILGYVPYLGPLLAGFPPMIDAFINCPSPWVVLGLLLFYVVLVTVEGYVIIPVYMGRSLDLNATTVLLACLYWGLVWGVVGLFLAMPLMAVLRTVCLHVPGGRPWANLMGTEELGDDAPTPPPDAPADDATQIILPPASGREA